MMTYIIIFGVFVILVILVILASAKYQEARALVKDAHANELNAKANLLKAKHKYPEIEKRRYDRLKSITSLFYKIFKSIF